MTRTPILLVAAVLAAAPALAQTQQQTSSKPGQAKAAQTGEKPASPAKGRPQAPATGNAASKPDAKGKADGKGGPAGAPGGAGAALLAEFGEWGAYATGSGKSRICYALSKPQDRQPKNLQGVAGYMFVSFRPGESVKNEVALVMGFPTKDGAAGEATIGKSKFALVTKDRNAWVKNPAEEPQVVAAMGRTQSLVVTATSARGNQTTDRYSLNGFADALARVRKECP